MSQQSGQGQILQMLLQGAGLVLWPLWVRKLQVTQLFSGGGEARIQMCL